MTGFIKAIDTKFILVLLIVKELKVFIIIKKYLFDSMFRCFILN
jgi:hypothetical protein